MTVTVLCGGIGGARFTLGVRDAVGEAVITAISNVGDDLTHWGLAISPDIDTMLYTLSGRVGPLGWGVADDTRNAMGAVAELGGDDWFILSDRDIGLHIARTERLARGERLSTITADFARRIGITARILPASDDPVRTIITTDAGETPFQEWFVRGRAAATVRAVRFDAAANARPAPGVLDAISGADRVVLAPSNPFISLDPILAVPGIREALRARRDDVVAVTPLIGRDAVKGPLATMLEPLGHERSPLGVARHLCDVIGGFVLDTADSQLADPIAALGVRVVTTSTLMGDQPARVALARVALRA